MLLIQALRLNVDVAIGRRLDAGPGGDVFPAVRENHRPHGSVVTLGYHPTALTGICQSAVAMLEWSDATVLTLQ